MPHENAEKSQIRPNAAAAESIEAARVAYTAFADHASKAIVALTTSGEKSVEEVRLVSMLQAITQNSGMIQLSLLVAGLTLKPKDGDETTTNAPAWSSEGTNGKTTGGVQ
jgi:hypothetical protein